MNAITLHFAENIADERTGLGETCVRYAVIALCLGCWSGIWSCKSESENYFQEETLTQNIVLGQLEAYDALEVDYLAEVALVNAGMNSLSDGCISFQNDVASNILTLDFGNGTCSAYPFGRIRSGKIIVAYSTHVGDTVATRTVTFDRYFVNNRKIDGQIDFGGITGDTSRLRGSCRFTNFKVSFPDGTGAVYNGMQSRLWTSGENNGQSNDNLYLITQATDSMKGVTFDQHSFTSNIKVGVTLNFRCGYLDNYVGAAGLIEVPQLDGYPSRLREVDFGSGACDLIVEIITWRRGFFVSVN